LIRSPIWLFVLSSHNAFGCETDGCCVDVALCQCCFDATPHTTIPFAHRGFVRVVAALPFAVGATVQSIPGESVYVPRPSWVRRFRPHLHHHNSICTRNGKSVLCVSSLLRITVFSCRPGLPACVLLYVRAPSNCYARLGGHMILFKLISLLPRSSVDRANALPVARFAMWNSHTYRLVLLIVVVSHRFYFRCDPL
jgi:hypothetical protein